MNCVPRLLPLLAVAVIGVLAINLIAGAGGLPNALRGARAWAEEVAGGAAPPTEATPTAAPAQPPGLGAPPPTPVQTVCAPTAAELAREAALSPSELMALQRLGERDKELDARDADQDTQLQLLAAAETKIDARINEMRSLREELQALLGQVDSQQAQETARLVKIYETMRPQSAAPQLAIMDDDVRLPILAGMKEAKLAAIMRYVEPQQGREIIEKLARYRSGALAVNEARAATTPVATAPAVPAPAQAAAPAAAGRQGATPATRPQTTAANAPAPRPAPTPTRASPNQPPRAPANTPAPKAATPPRAAANTPAPPATSTPAAAAPPAGATPSG